MNREQAEHASDARVLACLEAQSRAALFTTTITRGEQIYGACLLPEGHKLKREWMG
jgi:hypothetical protein